MRDLFSTMRNLFRLRGGHYVACDLRAIPSDAVVCWQGVDLKDLVTANLASEVEVQIALQGHYEQQGKAFDLSLTDFADAERNFASMANPLPVDYEHATLQEGMEAPAAGWIKRVTNKGGNGLWAVVAWTQRAAEHIRSGEYKFFSPVFFFNAKDPKTGADIGTMLGPGALTNFPLIQGMQPVTAKRTEEQSMNEHLQKILARLGITAGEQTTDEQASELIVAKVGAQPGQSAVVAAKGILTVLELPETATEDDVKGKILALKHPGNTVSAEEHQKVQAQLQQKEIDDAVNGALYAGKLTPAEKEWGTNMAKENLATFKSFIAQRPKVVPVQTTLAAAATVKTDTPTLNPLAIYRDRRKARGTTRA